MPCFGGKVRKQFFSYQLCDQPGFQDKYEQGGTKWIFRFKARPSKKRSVPLSATAEERGGEMDEVRARGRGAGGEHTGGAEAALEAEEEPLRGPRGQLRDGPQRVAGRRPMRRPSSRNHCCQ